MDKEQVIITTKKWIDIVVIGCHFCPFAAREVQRNSIYYQVEEKKDKATCLSALIKECERLDNDALIETTFLIFPDAFPSFRAYLDFLSLSNQLLKKQRYEGIYQLASFHPQYRFSGVPANDAANYTNRSPYPMLQLLREESIEKALAYYAGSAKEIPERNIRFAREKGLAYMKMLEEESGKTDKK